MVGPTQAYVLQSLASICRGTAWFAARTGETLIRGELATDPAMAELARGSGERVSAARGSFADRVVVLAGEPKLELLAAIDSRWVLGVLVHGDADPERARRFTWLLADELRRLAGDPDAPPPSPAAGDGGSGAPALFGLPIPRGKS